MLNFGGITHVTENPKGHADGYNFSLVGAIPGCMLDGRKPTTSDIMGGRVSKDGLAYYGRKWETVAQILEAAKKYPIVTLCSAPDCACRKLF